MKTREGQGSGFFVDGGADETVVVTNAHVVGLHHGVLVEWMHDADIVSRSANVIAIDYPHDLAILSVHSGNTPLPRPLQFGDPPRPGDDLWLCGYPLFAETSRLGRVVVSGWEVYRNAIADNFSVAALVLDGTVNFGNSGGALCNSDGRVVGVVCAQRVQPRIREPYTPNVHFSTLPLRDFVAFQVAAIEARRSPIGPFCFTPHGEYFVGWYNDRGTAIPASAAWRALAPVISQTGGSFFLLGGDVRLSRQRQDGRGSYYTLPLRLALTQ